MYEGASTLIIASLILIPKIGVYTVLVQVGLVRNMLLFCWDLHHLLSSGGFESNKKSSIYCLTVE